MRLRVKSVAVPHADVLKDKGVPTLEISAKFGEAAMRAAVPDYEKLPEFDAAVDAAVAILHQVAWVDGMDDASLQEWMDSVERRYFSDLAADQGEEAGEA